MKRQCLVLGMSVLLAACATNQKSQNGEGDDEARSIKTAKINSQLGMAYLERHDFQRAKQKLLLAINEAPNIPEPWYAMGYFQETTGNPRAANDYYLKAVKIAPERGDVQNNYGTFLCRNGRYNESITHFVLAAKDPNYLNPADAYENAGFCSMKIPNYPQAAQFFRYALSQDPARPLSRFELANTYYRQGNYHAARRELDTYTQIVGPSTESIRLSMAINKKLAPRVKPVVYHYEPAVKVISSPKKSAAKSARKQMSVNTHHSTWRHATKVV